MSFRRLFFLVLVAGLCRAPDALAQEAWMLLSRESGCTSLGLLVRMERLARTPLSPEDFAAMMRERGHTVSMQLPAGFPPAMTGKAVMVKYAENRAPVFLRAELCAGGAKP